MSHLLTICLFAVYRVCGSHNRRCMDSVVISRINDRISTLGTKEILWHNCNCRILLHTTHRYFGSLWYDLSHS